MKSFFKIDFKKSNLMKWLLHWPQKIEEGYESYDLSNELSIDNGTDW